MQALGVVVAQSRKVQHPNLPLDLKPWAMTPNPQPEHPRPNGMQALVETMTLSLLNQEKEKSNNILTYYECFTFRNHLCIVTGLVSKP
jgi:hypothetical protein